MTARAPVQIDRATADDLDAIRALAHDGLGATSVRLLTDDLAAPDRVCVVARIPDHPGVCGYGAAAVRVGICELLDVVVARAVRRRGVATALLVAIEAQARALGATQTTLEVAADNLAAGALYRRLGFVVEGRRPVYYPDGQDALLMWRRDPAGSPAGAADTAPVPTAPHGPRGRALTTMQGT